jgi:hypothetical protein
MSDAAPLSDDTADPLRERVEIGTAARVAVGLGTVAGVALVVHQLFNLRVGGVVLIEGRYLYMLGGLFLALAFLCFRIDGAKRGAPPVLDWLLSGASLGAAGYLA